MALRGNRPDFFAGVGGGGVGSRRMRGLFTPAAFCGGDGRRDAPSLRRRCNGTRLPAQIAGIFLRRLAGGGVGSRRMRGLFTPAAFCGGTGGGTLRLYGAVVTGQGSRRKLPVFLRGLVVAGRSFCKGQGCGARGRMIADLMRGGGGGDFAGAAGGAFLRFYYKSGGCVAFRGLRRYNNLIG